MSFILDALRRAERERTLGQAPRMEDITHGAAPPPRRPPRWVWVAAGAAISTVVLATLLWPRSAREERTSVTVTAEQPAPPPAPAPAPAPAVVTPPPAAPAEAPAVATLDDLTPPTPEGEMAMDDPELQPFDAGEPSGKPPPPPDDDAGAVELSPEPPPEATPSETVMLDPPPRGSASPAPAAAAPAGPPGVPKLRDMPASFRGDFPKLSVDVHAYDSDPKRRFVMINARRYREGERLSEGPQVIEIVPAGIVFDFRGQKVLYTLNR